MLESRIDWSVESMPVAVELLGEKKIFWQRGDAPESRVGLGFTFTMKVQSHRCCWGEGVRDDQAVAERYAYPLRADLRYHPDEGTSCTRPPANNQTLVYQLPLDS